MEKEKKPVFDVVGWVTIEEWEKKVVTYISGERWHLEIKGQPGALKHGDRVVVRVYKDKAE